MNLVNPEYLHSLSHQITHALLKTPPNAPASAFPSGVSSRGFDELMVVNDRRRKEEPISPTPLCFSDVQEVSRSRRCTPLPGRVDALTRRSACEFWTSFETLYLCALIGIMTHSDKHGDTSGRAVARATRVTTTTLAQQRAASDQCRIQTFRVGLIFDLWLPTTMAGLLYSTLTLKRKPFRGLASLVVSGEHPIRFF